MKAISLFGSAFGHVRTCSTWFSTKISGSYRAVSPAFPYRHFSSAANGDNNSGNFGNSAIITMKLQQELLDCKDEIIKLQRSSQRIYAGYIANQKSSHRLAVRELKRQANKTEMARKKSERYKISSIKYLAAWNSVQGTMQNLTARHLIERLENEGVTRIRKFDRGLRLLVHYDRRYSTSVFSSRHYVEELSDHQINEMLEKDKEWLHIRRTCEIEIAKSKKRLASIQMAYDSTVQVDKECNRRLGRPLEEAQELRSEAHDMLFEVIKNEREIEEFWLSLLDDTQKRIINDKLKLSELQRDIDEVQRHLKMATGPLRKLTVRYMIESVEKRHISEINTFCASKSAREDRWHDILIRNPDLLQDIVAAITKSDEEFPVKASGESNHIIAAHIAEIYVQNSPPKKICA